MTKKEFKINRQSMPTAQQAYAMLLGDKQENQIVDIPINLIDEIDDQPHKVHEDKIERISESMKAIGQIEPVIVVKSEIEGRYTLLAGRHRKAAAVLNGQSTLKAVISSETNEDLRRLILLATNNDRNNDYLPSEKAFAYREQMDLMKKLGYSKTTTAIAEENGTNRKSVHKYLQLTKLDSMLLHRVDVGEITVGAGYELSFISPEKQKKIGLELFNHKEIHIDNKLARQLRERPDDYIAILTEPTENTAFLHTGKVEDKTEKKTKTSLTKKINDPPYKFNMCVACILFTKCDDIFKKIITEYLSTEELCEYIKNTYGKSKTDYYGFSEIPLPYNSDKLCNGIYNIFFTNNKCIVSSKVEENKVQTFDYPLTLINSICREYLRKFIKTEQILNILNGK
ncbi:MAG: ParB/RepB/Spo0J family partition protein [Ruminococcus sp.]